MPALSTSPHIDPVAAPDRQVWCIRQIPALPTSAEAAGRLAVECQAQGFTHLLLATAEDFVGPPGRDETLASLAKACHAADLVLLMDLAVCPVPRTGPLATEHAGWFGTRRDTSDDPPDPRKLVEQPDLAWLRHEDGAVLDQATAWWRARVALSKDLGVGGFRCLLPQHMPARFWRALARPDMCFLAWTPGITPAESRDLADCGFAASFVPVTSDLARVVREAADAAVIAPVIAVPDNRPAALRLAAGLGAGLMQMDGHWSTEEMAAANALAKSLGPGSRAGGWRLLGAPGAAALALARPAGHSLIVAAVNNSATPQELPLAKLLPHIAPLTRLEPIGASASAVGAEAIALGPGDVKFLRAAAERPITLPRNRGIPLSPALKAPRLAIENVTPAVDGGAFPARRIVGETVQIEADIVVDGHEQVAAALRWRPADSRIWQEVPMRALGNDRWAAPLPLLRLGTHYFTICAWIDVFGGFRHGLQKLHEAGKDIRLELGEGRDMVRATADRVEDDALRVVLTGIADHLAQCPPEEQLRLLLSAETANAMQRADPRAFAATTPVAYRLDAERAAARFAAWYELFPRSQSGDAGCHGTFADVIGRLPAIQAMGFDVLYFPPIHPIGATNRKGRNNSLKAEPGDVGSPYAIGAAEGGHDALHPELGSFEDFQRLRAAAADHGLELALDFAIQCAPDHPWLSQHPEWFVWRADGTVRHAQNPPKTYEDIVNVDFYAGGDAAPALWAALRDVVQFWVDQGIRLFRVDNPHTKPLPFWEWLIADIRSRHPDAIFLSEAFTAPRRMYRLAKIGFSQSYTYFTWRNTKAELTEYLRQLNEAPVREFFRPHFFVNTPDINPLYLQTSGRAGFLVRAALAATMSGLWGLYSGFELCEAAALPGREEYLDSEKYELRPRDWAQPGNIVAEIAQLNHIRRENPALHSHLGISFYNAFNDQIIYFAKATPDRDNVVLVAVNLDPHHVQEADVEIPLWEWGLPDHGALAAEDLLTGERFTWHGKIQHLRLDPGRNPYAIWRIGAPRVP